MREGTQPQESLNREEELQKKKRRYNRAYMRRWRANPKHAEREQLTRRRSYHAWKIRALRKPESADRNMRGELFCGICRKRPAVTQVTRLKMPKAQASE